MTPRCSFPPRPLGDCDIATPGVEFRHNKYGGQRRPVLVLFCLGFLALRGLPWAARAHERQTKGR